MAFAGKPCLNLPYQRTPQVFAELPVLLNYRRHRRTRTQNRTQNTSQVALRCAATAASVAFPCPYRSWQLNCEYWRNHLVPCSVQRIRAPVEGGALCRPLQQWVHSAWNTYEVPSQPRKHNKESMASQQPLRRLGLDERIVSRMSSEGLHTVGDLFSKTELQLVQALNLNQFEIVNLLCAVAKRIAPETKTAGDLLRERRETGGSFFVATGLPTLDNSLQVQLLPQQDRQPGCSYDMIACRSTLLFHTPGHVVSKKSAPHKLIFRCTMHDRLRKFENLKI